MVKFILGIHEVNVIKKYIKGILVLFACSFILVACSDSDNANNNQENGESNGNQNNDNNTNIEENDDNTLNEDVDSENNDLEGNDNADNSNSSESSGSFEPETEDQEGLGVGDTGKFDTILGMYDMTVDGDELVGKELDGEHTEFDNLLVLDLTIKNTGDETIQLEDIMESMRLGDDKDVNGYSDAAEFFDSIEGLSGDLEPGEKKSGEFITDVFEADTYYFKKDSGNISGGSSNQVVWEIEPEEK